MARILLKNRAAITIIPVMIKPKMDRK